MQVPTYSKKKITHSLTDSSVIGGSAIDSNFTQFNMYLTTNLQTTDETTASRARLARRTDRAQDRGPAFDYHVR